MIDTHCHLTSSRYHESTADILADAQQHGVTGAITVSTTSEDAKHCLDLALSFPNVWCSAGVHPLNCDEPVHWPDILSIAKHPRCVAWGELGLDNHYDDPPRPLQDQILEEQLTLIEESNIDKPIIVHCRDAFDDLLPILKNTTLPPHRFVFHCFTSGEAEARRVLDFGAWVSFTGVVTFKNSQSVRDACLLVPDDRIMIETDAPFLTPEPYRKIRTNSPRYSIETARFVAKLRNIQWDDFHHLINENAERFFSISIPISTPTPSQP